jgi:hypothetical protein
VAEQEGGTNGSGHTADEDRRLGLDTFVFFDYGRPRSDRLGETQAEVVAVVNPEPLHQAGTIITERDYLDILDTNEYNPQQYMAGLTEPEDFLATAAERISLVASREGHWQSGVYINHRLTVGGWQQGKDGDWDQFDRRPAFSTWEVKVPERVDMENTYRLVFRSDELRDAFVAKHGDRFETVVVPDIKRALASGEDVLGIKPRYDAALNRRIHDDYTQRKAAVDGMADDPGQTTYCKVGQDVTDEYNPDWFSAEVQESPDEILNSERSMQKVAGALQELFFDDADDVAIAPPEPTRIAKVVRKGGIPIIEEIIQHEL